MDEIVFNKMVECISSKMLLEDEILSSELYYKFKHELREDWVCFPEYTFDGRADAIIFKALRHICRSHGSYMEFLKVAENELKKLSVPCIILIPLNYLRDDTLSSDIILTDDIVLFKKSFILSEETCEKKYLRSSLERYFEKKLHISFPGKHIVSSKDNNFFNFPVLSILIKNISTRVEEESGRIANAVYSFFRMLDFDNEQDCNGWGYFHFSSLAPAHSYGVYYDEDNKLCNKPFFNKLGYGHSFFFQCVPILDVNSQQLIKNEMQAFTELLTKYLKCIFCTKTNLTIEEKQRMKRWQNAVQLFNSAYELASIEKYDTAMLILLTLLESLLINQSKKKRDTIKSELSQVLNYKSESQILDAQHLIEKTYTWRNKFVHQGEGFESSIHIKSLSDYQGGYIGMKPFTRTGLWFYDDGGKCVRALFRLVIEVIKGWRI